MRTVKQIIREEYPGAGAEDDDDPVERAKPGMIVLAAVLIAGVGWAFGDSAREIAWTLLIFGVAVIVLSVSRWKQR